MHSSELQVRAVSVVFGLLQMVPTSSAATGRGAVSGTDRQGKQEALYNMRETVYTWLEPS